MFKAACESLGGGERRFLQSVSADELFAISDLRAACTEVLAAGVFWKQSLHLCSCLGTALARWGIALAWQGT